MCVFSDVKSGAAGHMQELFYGLEWKLLITVPAAFLADWLCGDWRIIWIWIGFMGLDLGTGMYRSLVFGNFQKSKLYDWSKKFLGQLFFIGACNMLLWGFSITSGEPNTFLNLLVLFMAVCEAASAAENINEACPGIIPVQFQWMIHKVRRGAARKFSAAVDDGDISDFPDGDFCPPTPPDRRRGEVRDNGRRRRARDVEVESSDRHHQD